jgi:hypothetical protein
VAKLPKLLRVVDSGEQQKRCELSGLSDGSTDTRGYRYLTVDGRGYLSSRFAYLYMTAFGPKIRSFLSVATVCPPWPSTPRLPSPAFRWGISLEC